MFLIKYGEIVIIVSISSIKIFFKSTLQNINKYIQLKIAIIKFKLERSDFYSLIDGMMMDAEMDIKFPSRKKLNLYCDRVKKLFKEEFEKKKPSLINVFTSKIMVYANLPQK